MKRGRSAVVGHRVGREEAFDERRPADLGDGRMESAGHVCSKTMNAAEAPGSSVSATARMSSPVLTASISVGTVVVISSPRWWSSGWPDTPGPRAAWQWGTRVNGKGGTPPGDRHAPLSGGRATGSLSAVIRAVRPQVVIVDDQPRFRDVARLLLEARGYDVVAEAGCAAAALDAIEQHEPSALLLDVRLGDEDGFAVCTELMRRRPRLAVLLASDGDYEERREEVESCGARGFVRKSRLAHVDLGRFWPRAERLPEAPHPLDL
jgi:CheY-like chemotaxis protein